jgi:hypothetical protein
MQEPAELTEVIQKRYRCRHIHAAGHQCGSPALRNEHFCYYHHTTRRPAPAAGKFRHLDAAEPFILPVVEDRTSALLVASQLLSRIASNDLDPVRAGKLLYNLQIITALLPREPRPDAAIPAATPEPAQTPPPLVEDLVLDETHGMIAPIAEILPPEPATTTPQPPPATSNLQLSSPPSTPRPHHTGTTPAWPPSSLNITSINNTKAQPPQPGLRLTHHLPLPLLPTDVRPRQQIGSRLDPELLHQRHQVPVDPFFRDLTVLDPVDGRP